MDWAGSGFRTAKVVVPPKDVEVAVGRRREAHAVARGGNRARGGECRPIDGDGIEEVQVVQVACRTGAGRGSYAPGRPAAAVLAARRPQRRCRCGRRMPGCACMQRCGCEASKQGAAGGGAAAEQHIRVILLLLLLLLLLLSLLLLLLLGRLSSISGSRRTVAGCVLRKGAGQGGSDETQSCRELPPAGAGAG